MIINFVKGDLIIRRGAALKGRDRVSKTKLGRQRTIKR